MLGDLVVHFVAELDEKIDTAHMFSYSSKKQKNVFSKLSDYSFKGVIWATKDVYL